MDAEAQSKGSGRMRVAPALVVLVMLVATSCSSVGAGSGEDGSGSAGGSEGLDGGGPQARAVQESGVEMPFVRYFAVAKEAAKSMDEAWLAAVGPVWKDHESHVAKCMKAAGFDYFPREPPTTADDAIPDGRTINVPWLSESREEVERFGYGYSGVPSLPRSPVDEGEEKNVEYVGSLSGKAAAVYEEALSGHTDYESYLEPGGCRLEAVDRYGEIDQLFTEDSSWYIAPVQGMVAELEKLTGSASMVVDTAAGTAHPIPVEKDERLVGLDREWSDCMAASGLDYEPDTWDFGLGSAFGLAVGTGVDGRTGPEDGELYDPADVPVDQQSLVGSDYEIAIAVADFGCRAATDYVGRYTQIQFDLETAYIAAHQTELDKMVAVAQG